MLLYLDHAWEKYRAEGRMTSLGELFAAVKEGAVQRIRPKIMTVCAILFGLLPIMWSPTTQAGADVMKRIAAPMIGGVITSAILELLIYPVIFVIWKKHSLPKPMQAARNDDAGIVQATESTRPAVLRSPIGSIAFSRSPDNAGFAACRRRLSMRFIRTRRNRRRAYDHEIPLGGATRQPLPGCC